MLLELRIKDFAIIEEVHLNFYNGMTVLTGETGAGKSIIIDAAGLLAGGRGSTEFVRHGAKKCVLEGHFSVSSPKRLQPILDEYGIELEDNILIVQREIFASGRTICRVNGSIVTISNLKEIGSALIDIHGQNEHQELMHQDQHIHLLDQFASDSISPLRNEFQQKREQYLSLKKRMDQWIENEKEYAQRIDMLEFQVKEIEEVQLVEGEDSELQDESKKLSNFHNVSKALQLAYDSLQESEGSAIEKTGVAMDELSDISDINQDYDQLASMVSSLFYQLQEVSSDILSELDQLEFDEGRLFEIEERLNTIQQLKRKYGDSVEEVLNYYNEASEELYQLKHSDSNIDQLREELDKITPELEKLGLELSNERRKQADILEEAIVQQLRDLYMDKAQFSVEFKKEPSLANMNAFGMDYIEFYISTNPGEPLKPLQKIASGGELSRMMLAIKTIFSSSQGITSIIFDEVDTGVSGRVANAIANKIHSVAENSQVLCISHLPQVAAIADEHLYIYKSIENNRTKTHVELLDDKERIVEVARMLSGSETTETSLNAAKELLEKARQS